MLRRFCSRKRACHKNRRRAFETLEKRLFLANWSGDLTGGALWTNTEVQHITGSVRVPAGDTLTIQPGTVVKFDGGTSLTVDGTLNAPGTGAQSIYFTSIFDDAVGGDTNGDGATTTPARGQWRQILFTSGSGASVVDHAVVRYGGNGVGGQVEAVGASPTFSNSTFAHSEGFGLSLTGSNAILSDDTFQHNDSPENGTGVGGAIRMDVNSQPIIHGIAFEDNFVNAVWIDPGTLPVGATSWNNPDVVYFVPRTVTVPQGASLTIGAGQVIKLARSIVVDGTLRAEGTPAEPVFFTSIHDNSVGGDTIDDFQPDIGSPGDWNQILFTATSTNGLLDHAVVRYGGYFVGGQVEVVGSSPTFSNSEFSHSIGFGLRLTGSDATLIGDTFHHNDSPENGTGVGGAINMDVNSQPIIQGITLEDNFVNAVWVDPGTLPVGATSWNNPDAVYFVPRTVTVPQGASLTIGAGQVIKLGRSIVVEGALRAEGTAAQPVYFTSIHDNSVGGDTIDDFLPNIGSPGDWNQILFTATSTNGLLDHAVVRYGGYFVGGQVEVVGSSPTFSNSEFSHSFGFGLRLTGSNATLIGDTFHHNDSPENGTGVGGAIAMDVNSQPIIRGITCEDNFVNAVWVDPGTLPVGITSWNNPDVVYFVPRTVTVPLGATLTIGAGQVFKLARSIIVEGTLRAEGTAAQPVYFTSIHDNSVGGDTIADLLADNGSPGDWNQILFTNTSANGLLDHAVVRYGGAFVGGQVEAIGASPTFSNSVFSHSAGFGLSLTDSNAIVTGDAFEHNDLPENGSGVGGAIRISANSPPSFDGITFLDNFVNAVWVDPGTLPAGVTTWDDPKMVYFVPRTVTVPVGATLMIGAGQVIKLGRSIVVQGTLKAQGTAAQPVIFTSMHDNSAGGDTIDDGPATSGSPGDWRGLQFTSTSTDDVLDHIEARYGNISEDGTPGMISATGCVLTVSNSVIRDSNLGAINANTGSSVTVVNCLIVNTLNVAGVQGGAGATLNVINCTIDGNFQGVVLDSTTATLTNNLVTNSVGNGVVQTGAANVTMRFNDVSNSNAINYAGLPDQTGVSGNISVDPKYFNRLGGQYQLRPGSPVEDAGAGAGAPPTDIFGNPRFKDPNLPGRGDGSGYDMGAIEVQQTATSNVDLAATAIAGPLTGIQDQTVTVNWTVESVGEGTATGAWRDAVYLSASPVLTPDAILLGDVQRTGDLGPNQSYNASGTFALPGVTPGDYYFIVRANSGNDVFEARALANNSLASTATVAMDLPALTLGVPSAGQLPATGAGKLYKVTVPAAGDLNITLAGSAGATNELYVAYGQAPSRQAFLARGARAGSPNQTVSLADAQAGTYIILVYGANLPNAENFSLTASAQGFSLAGVSPIQGSNTGRVTLSIEGAQFDGNSQPRLIDSAGAAVLPQQVYYTDTGLISATFDLTGRPLGPADVQVVNTGGVTQTLPDAFNIIHGQEGRLVTSVSSPDAVCLGRQFTVYVDYANVGDTDLLAPIMLLGNSGSSPLLFSPTGETEGHSVNLVAANPTGPAGILPPGAHSQIAVYANATGADIDHFQLFVGGYPAVAIDWAGVSPIIRPADLTDADWNALFAHLQANVGPTWEDFQRTVARDATLLPAAQGLNYSLRDVFQLEFDKAFSQLHPNVSGKLFLGDTAHPLGNVELTLYDPALGQVVETIALNDGTFVFPFVDPGSYLLRIDGYVNASATPLIVGAGGLAGVQAVATRGAVIAGSVALNPFGVAVRGQLVVAVSSDNQPYHAITDDNGKYVIDALPAGDYVVSAGGDLLTTANRSVSLIAGQLAPAVDLVVQQGGVIQGTITGPGGPVADAIVLAVGDDGETSSATTSASGAYEIQGLTGQVYSVTASFAGLAAATASDVHVTTGASVTGVNLALIQGGQVSGTVTRQTDGLPVELAAITLQLGALTFTALSDENGVYEAPDLPPGAYTVVAVGAGFMTRSTGAIVTAGAVTNLALSLAPTGRVSGVVTDSVSGQPVVKVIVYAADASGLVAATTTDAAGAYLLEGFDAGAYQIVVGDLLSPGLAQTTITFDAAHTDVTTNFSLALAGMVSGVVFMADGATPLAGAQVALVANGQIVLSMSTDDLGQYTFDVVAPGVYQLEAVGPAGEAFPAIVGVNMSGGAVLTGRNFTAGALAVSGAVRDAASAALLNGANVSISRADAGLAATGVDGLVTANDGAFNFGHLVPGDYRLVVRAAGHAAASTVITVPPGGASGIVINLGAESVLYGTIRDSASGSGLADAEVVLSEASNSGLGGSAVTDAFGNYQIAGLAAGAYSLRVAAAGYQTVVVQNLSLGQEQRLMDASLAAANIQVEGVARTGARLLSGVAIIVIDANNIVVADATTAAEGTYQIRSLAPGTYTVEASALGFFTSAPAILTVGAGANVTGFDIALNPVGLSDIQINV